MSTGKATPQFLSLLLSSSLTAMWQLFILVQILELVRCFLVISWTVSDLHNHLIFPYAAALEMVKISSSCHLQSSSSTSIMFLQTQSDHATWNINQEGQSRDCLARTAENQFSHFHFLVEICPRHVSHLPWERLVGLGRDWVTFNWVTTSSGGDWVIILWGFIQQKKEIYHWWNIYWAAERVELIFLYQSLHWWMLLGQVSAPTHRTSSGSLTNSCLASRERPGWWIFPSGHSPSIILLISFQGYLWWGYNTIVWFYEDWTNLNPRTGWWQLKTFHWDLILFDFWL